MFKCGTLYGVLLAANALISGCTAEIGSFSSFEENPEFSDQLSAKAIIYLNRQGGSFSPGETDSRSNTSVRLVDDVEIETIPFDETDWESIVNCVQDIYAPFDLLVTDSPPQWEENHMEIVFAANNSLDVVGFNEVRAVGGEEDLCRAKRNMIGFAFAYDARGAMDYCQRAASAVASSFTLSPTNGCGDVTSSISLCNNGEDMNFEISTEPRDCRRGACQCSESTQQRSHDYLTDILDSLNKGSLLRLDTDLSF